MPVHHLTFGQSFFFCLMIFIPHNASDFIFVSN